MNALNLNKNSSKRDELSKQEQAISEELKTEKPLNKILKNAMSESQFKEKSNENLKSSNESIGKSILVKSDGLEKSVCSSESSAYFTPFYSLPKKLCKSSSFNSVDNLQRSGEEENASQKNISVVSNTKLNLQHHLQHRHSMQLNSNFDLSNPSQSFTPKSDNFEATNNDLIDNSYSYFLNSLNCDTNCSCAYHKNSVRHHKPNPRVQYHHHPYYDHHSFDQNVRLSQTNLNELAKIESNMLVAPANQNEKSALKLDQIGEKSSFVNKNNKEPQSMFNFGYFELFSFFGN